MIDTTIIHQAVDQVFAKHGLNLPPTPKLIDRVTTAPIREALIAQPKSYPLAAESVSAATKKDHVALYQGYIDAHNKVSARLDALPDDSSGSGSSDFRSLKSDEAYLRNAVFMHELYFANCFDPKSEVYSDMLACMRLERDFGTFDGWQRCFVDCALAAREGWAACGYDGFARRYVNFFIDGHADGIPVGVTPVFVIDMWCHAHRDYGNDRKSYVVSQMREINWNVVDDRVQRCERMENAS